MSLKNSEQGCISWIYRHYHCRQRQLCFDDWTRSKWDASTWKKVLMLESPHGALTCHRVASGAHIHLWIADSVLFSQKHNAQLLFDEFLVNDGYGSRNLAHLETTSCLECFWEDHEIDFQIRFHVPTGDGLSPLADQSVRLSPWLCVCKPRVIFSKLTIPRSCAS